MIVWIESFILIVGGFVMLINTSRLSGTLVLPMTIMFVGCYLYDWNTVNHFLAAYLTTYLTVFRIDGTKRNYIQRLFN